MPAGRSRWGRGPVVGTALGAGWVGLTLATMIPLRSGLSPASPALVLVVAVLVAAVVGGAPSAIAVAVVAAIALNLAFIPPYGTLKVDVVEDAVALGAFLVVALAVGLLVAAERERRRDAQAKTAELRALHVELESAVAERARLAEEAARVAALERLDTQRSALLRSVSHDLRTPLATIRAVSSDLRDGAAYDEPTRAELLATVCDEAERLDRIVANLLSMSRIEAGSLAPDRQAVPVDELVHHALRRLARVFRDVRVQVDISPDLPTVDADYTLLDLVVTNLLENAARHAPAGSTVWLSAGARAGMIDLRVADEGYGIPEWERSRVFEPFRRGEGSRGTGVGLAICKAVVDAHGGRITVEPTAGGGATFLVSLPVRE